MTRDEDVENVEFTGKMHSITDRYSERKEDAAKLETRMSLDKIR